MKKYISVFPARRMLLVLSFFVILSQFSRAQVSGWSWSNPSPQGNDLFKVIFVDSVTGYAVGHYGTIIKTVDGGNNWNQLSTLTSNSLFSIVAKPNGELFAVGDQRTILRSYDKGITWDKVAVEPDAEILGFNDIAFIDNDTGYMVGARSSFYRTTDGGNNWELIYSLSGSWAFYSIHLISSTIAIVRSVSYTNALKTTDGGHTWTPFPFSGTRWVRSVWFTSPDIGFCAGNSTDNSGFVAKTSDGGISWTNAAIPSNMPYSNLFFLTPDTGYVFGNGNTFKTTDAGVTWSMVSLTPVSEPVSVYFTPEGHGCTVGATGKIFTSDNGGISWTGQRKGSSAWLQAVSFPCQDTGYAAGATDILKTSDRGGSWNLLVSAANQMARDIQFITPQTGYVIKQIAPLGKNYFSKTTDGGLSWQDQLIDNVQLWDMEFLDSSHGYLVYSETMTSGILKTTDGGITWVKKNPQGCLITFKTCFINKDTGFVLGEVFSERKILYKTENGCKSFKVVFIFDETIPCQNVYFYNDTTGYMLSERWDPIIQQTIAKIWKSTDAGENWFLLPFCDALLGCHLSDISFVNPDTGFVIGHRAVNSGSYGYSESVILVTYDGGRTWLHQIPKTVNKLYAMTFTDTYNGYAVGENGTILKTTGMGDLIQLLVTPDTVNVPELSGSYTFSVYSNSNWFVKSDAEWCSTSPDIGNGNAFFTVHYSENSSNEDRVATIKIITANLDSSTVQVFQSKSSLGLGTFTSQNIQIYPNPVTDRAVLVIPGGSIGYSVYDLLGHCMISQRAPTFSEQKVILNLSNFPSGTYILKVITNTGSFAEKIVIFNQSSPIK